MVYVFLNFQGLALALGLWCLMPRSTIFQLFRGCVLLVEETGVSGENHQCAVTNKLYHTMLYRVHLVIIGNQTHSVGDRDELHGWLKM
jgi:hypothetical protein